MSVFCELPWITTYDQTDKAKLDIQRSGFALFVVTVRLIHSLYWYGIPTLVFDNFAVQTLLFVNVYK